MDVDVNMKTLFFISLLLFSASLHAEPLIIFGTKLEIDDICRLKATNEKGESKLIQLSLPKSSNCKFLKYYETNLIHLERISNSYMFFIEMSVGHPDRCMSKYTAVAVKNDGKVLASATYARSGTCPPSIERKEFDYFAHKMKILNQVMHNE